MNDQRKIEEQMTSLGAFIDQRYPDASASVDQPRGTNTIVTKQPSTTPRAFSLAWWRWLLQPVKEGE